MIQNPNIAKQINELMIDMFNRLVESCQTVRETCSAEECTAYSKATSGLASAIVFDVLEPLYSKNPSLKPANWDDEDEAFGLNKSRGEK